MEEASFRLFIETDYGKLVGAIAVICGSRPAAEDAVQEALVRAWQRFELGEDISSLAAWVTTVALNLTRNRLRHLSVELRARHRLVDDRSIGGGIEPDGSRVDMARALSQLPRRQREAVILHHYLDLDLAEVASRMGTRQGTAKSLLFRARRTLARELADSDEAIGVDAR